MPRQINHDVFGKWVIGFWKPHGIGARVAIALAVTAGCFIFSYGSQRLGIPPTPGFDGSLMRQPSVILALLGVIVLLAVATLVGTVLAGAVRFEAGLFSAAIGLICISARSGTMHSILFEFGGGRAYYALSAEITFLGLILMLMWAMLGKLFQAQQSAAFDQPVSAPPNETKTDSPDQSGASDGEKTDPLTRSMALATQVIGTAVILTPLLWQSDAKKQALVSVGLAAWLSSAAAYACFKTRPSIWYWMGPMLVGLIGYLVAAMNHDPHLAIGNPQGLLAPLARPLPLDYASAGTAGAILGYWMIRNEHAAKPEKSEPAV